MAAAPVPRDPRLAAWLVGKRRAIERALAERLAEGGPAPGAPEVEALRRFRSFAARAIQTGQAPPPALDGLRPDERRLASLLAAWLDAVERVGGPEAGTARAALAPLAERFRAALRGTAPARRKSGVPRRGRRAVMAAIDRVADAYLAIDVDRRTIVDANPAAGALLGMPRDALLGADAARILAEEERETWWSELDALAEGADARRFGAGLRAEGGLRVPVDVSLTRYSRRGQVLGLALLRPTGPG